MKQLVIVFLAVALSVGVVKLLDRTTVTAPAQPVKESAYDRVMRTKTIRCGYALWPPTLTKNPETGKLGGIIFDIIEKAAENLHLKIEWAEETGWGSFIEGLRSNRFDLMCAALWQNASRAPFVNYSIPVFYSAVHFYARADDTRFDDNLSKLDSPDYKLSTMDGEMSQIIATRLFPKAKQVAVPQLADVTQMFLNVAARKTDGVFSEPGIARGFAAKNPGAIRQVTKEPFQTFPDCYGAAIGEDKFIRMIDSALIEMLNSGDIDRIVAKYEPDRSIFMPAAKPYTYIPAAKLP